VENPNSHHIPEQNTAYRRGMVLGLTMAEVGILIIFVLLLLLGFTTWQDEVAMKGKEAVKVEHLRALEEAHSLLTQLRSSLQIPNNASVEDISTLITQLGGALQIPNNASVEEISELIRALGEVRATPEGQTTLKEIRAALEQNRRILDQIEKEGGSEALAKQVEQQSYQIANQKGQFQRYESRLKEAGLGKGENPCWAKPDGTEEYLYDVVLASNGIRMREYKYDNREPERSLLPMPAVDPREELSPAEFRRLTQPLYNHSLAANCRFFVVIYDATGPTEKELYKQLLQTVEGHFYKRLDHGPAPF